MTTPKFFKNTNTPLAYLLPQSENTVNNSPAGQLLEKIIRLPLGGALLAAVAFWTVQQGVFPLMLSCWTTLSNLIIPLTPCVFAVIVPLVANPMYSLLYLLGVFFSTVLFYLVNGAEYLGLTLMIVYVGAVAVIFLFVLMLLNAKDQADIKDLMVHTTQYLAVIVIVALFGRSVVQVYKPVEAFVISRESGLTVLEPTSAEAVEFFVRFQFNDISTIVPLYTQHGVTFVVLTTVLLSALLGAIILATQTTERPVSAQTSQEVTPRRVVTPVKAVASLLTAAGSLCLPSLDACELFTLFSFFATLCAVTPFYRKGRYSKFPAARPPANILPSRYWRWRTSRATSLVRAKSAVLDCSSNVVRPYSATEKSLRYRDFKYVPSTRKLALDAYYPDSKVPRRRPWPLVVRVSTPANLSPSGLYSHLKLLWQINVVPVAAFYAWRVYFFCIVFPCSLIAVSALLLALSSVVDYPAAWEYLCELRKAIASSTFANQSSLYQATPAPVREALLGILLVPGAVVKLLLSNLIACAFIAALFTLDLIQLTDDSYITNLHRFKTRAVYSRAVRDHVTPPQKELTAEELAHTKRHPDRGRHDWVSFFLFKDTHEYRAQQRNLQFRQYDPYELIRAGKAQAAENARIAAEQAATVAAKTAPAAEVAEVVNVAADSVFSKAPSTAMHSSIFLLEGCPQLLMLLFFITSAYVASVFVLLVTRARVQRGTIYSAAVAFIIAVFVAYAITYADIFYVLQQDVTAFFRNVNSYAALVISWWNTPQRGGAVLVCVTIALPVLALYTYFIRRYLARKKASKDYVELTYAGRRFTNSVFRRGYQTFVQTPKAAPAKIVRQFTAHVVRPRPERKARVNKYVPIRRQGFFSKYLMMLPLSLWTPTPEQLEIIQSFPKEIAYIQSLSARFPTPDVNVDYSTPKSMSADDRLALWEYMVTRSTELAEKYYEIAVRVIESDPYAERKAAQSAQTIPEDFYRLVSETPLPYPFGSDTQVAGPFSTWMAQDATAWFYKVAPIGLEFATVYFIPEIFLGLAIVRVIITAFTELSKDRAHKLIAISCWRAACEGLALVVLLYVLQLQGSVPFGSAFYGYLYISVGLITAKLAVALTSLFVLHSAGNYIREHTRHVLEYPMVILIAVLLLLILVSTSNLLLLFLVLAGFSLNLYILVVFDAADAASREASLKYFYLSTLSTGFILFGTLLIYAVLGDVSYRHIMFCTESSFFSLRKMSIICTASVFLVIGFLFKLSAFPGHLWAVEVYEGSPMPVMAFFILPVKIAIFVTFLRLLNTALYAFSVTWLPILSVAALGSLVWGAFAAVHSRKTVRFLGYASINQMGFLILGLATNTDLGLRAALFYLSAYAIMTGGFLLVLLNLRKLNGAYFTSLSDFRGLWKTESILCWSLASSLFSMAGIPPLAGFFGKYYILSSALDRGLFTPVIAALGLSVVTTYYYIRIIRTLWFEGSAAVKTPVVLLSCQQRVLLTSLSALLWIAAPFVPVLVTAFDASVFTLTICGDASMPILLNIWSLPTPQVSPPSLTTA